MLDALGRRERGTELGRVARGIGLAFRLELEAAALILEALSATSETVHAVGAALVAPRARAATRTRIDPQKGDAWVDAIDPELAGMLVCVATALTTQDDAARNDAIQADSQDGYPAIAPPWDVPSRSNGPAISFSRNARVRLVTPRMEQSRFRGRSENPVPN